MCTVGPTPNSPKELGTLGPAVFAKITDPTITPARSIIRALPTHILGVGGSNNESKQQMRKSQVCNTSCRRRRPKNFFVGPRFPKRRRLSNAQISGRRRRPGAKFPAAGGGPRQISQHLEILHFQDFQTTLGNLENPPLVLVKAASSSAPRFATSKCPETDQAHTNCSRTTAHTKHKPVAQHAVSRSPCDAALLESEALPSARASS